MLLNRSEFLEGVRWLESNASAPVRYRLRRDFPGIAPAGPDPDGGWREVVESRDAALLFECRNPDGSWFSGGPWGPRGYAQTTGRGYTSLRPKFVTTAWILPFLGDLGFTGEDARVRASCDWMLADMGYADGPDHALPSAEPMPRGCCGIAAIPLRAMASVGLAGDPAVAAGWSRLIANQRDDGGWLDPRHLADSPPGERCTTRGRWPWDRSCAWGTWWAVEALYFARGSIPAAAPALRRSLAFLLDHLSRKEPRDYTGWVYHGHSPVKELLMCLEAGFDPRHPVLAAWLEWLRGMRRPDEGCFRASARPQPDFVRLAGDLWREQEAERSGEYWRKTAKVGAPVLRYYLYHLAEDDWLTYHALRIAAAADPGVLRMPQD